MRALIRFITKTTSGALETRDRVFDGEILSIGRATDQVLHLKDARVALEHARITGSKGRIQLVCKSPAQVSVNGALCREAALQAGDSVQIGANTLSLFEAEEGFDCALTFELQAGVDTRQTRRQPMRLTLTELGFRKRRWAWALFAACLGLGLLLPWGGASRPGGSAALRALHLPSDRAWSPGALHPAHALLEQRCEACHEQPFVKVRDQACLACHAVHLRQHVPAGHAAVSLSLQKQCSDCHTQHSNTAQRPTQDQRVCGDCHATPPTGIAAVSDFLRQHPDFHVDPAAVKNSHLYFSHARHLAAKGVRSPTGKVLMQCADCHRPEAGGARMQPIHMEQHCASCHRLEFDPAEPSRVLPHGDPQRVLDTLVDYYSARYLAGYPDKLATAQPDRAVALPSIDLPASARAKVLGLARTRAQLAARDVFERRICVDCHEVTRQDSGGNVAWTVTPVKLAAEWLPHAKFSHAAHSTALTPCSTCHAAVQSRKSGDVLMPHIAQCRQCHGGEKASLDGAARVPSTCTLCHDYHAQPLKGAR